MWSKKGERLADSFTPAPPAKLWIGDVALVATGKAKILLPRTHQAVELFFLRAAPHAACTSTGLSQGAPFLIRVERRLPALSSRRGTNPAQERRCPTVGNGLMSVPISAITVSVAVAPSPGTSFSRSTMS